MDENRIFSDIGHTELDALLDTLQGKTHDFITSDDMSLLRTLLHNVTEEGQGQRDVFGMNTVVRSLRTAAIAIEETGQIGRASCRERV